MRTLEKLFAEKLLNTEHFSFFTFFSDFVIFQVVKCMFLIFHDFQFSCHIPRPTVDISK